MDNEYTNDHEEIIDRLDTLEASLALLMNVLTRTETRLCKLIVHLGAQHLIETSRESVTR